MTKLMMFFLASSGVLATVLILGLFHSDTDIIDSETMNHTTEPVVKKSMNTKVSHDVQEDIFEQLTRMQAQIRDLKKTVSILSQNQAAYDQRGELNATEPDFEETNYENFEELAEERERQQRIALVDELEAESADIDWSATAEAELAVHLEAGLAEYKGEEITISTSTCRTTFCRLDIDVEDSQDLAFVMTLIPWETHFLFHPEEGDETIGTLYIMRPEYDSMEDI